MTFGALFYAARVVFQTHHPPAVNMTKDFYFCVLQPLAFQKWSEHSEHRNKTAETQLEKGFRAFRRFRGYGVCSYKSDRNRALLPHF